MATKKELDDMLDNLRNPSAAKKKTQKAKVSDAFDNASLDDLLDALSDENAAEQAAAPKTRARKENSNEATKVFDKKPVSAFDRKFGKKIKPIPDTPVERPVYPSDDEPSPVKKKKMKIVISGELPDYEAIRQQELEKDRAAKAAEEARKAEETAAQEARAAAEKIAEKRRLDEEKAKEEAEKAALERQRLAEERAKEEARIAEERKRLAEERAAEEARIAAEKKAKEEEKRLAEERAEAEARFAEKKKRLAEKKAAELAEKRKRLEEEKARLEAEEAAMEAEEAEEIIVSEEDALKALAEADDSADAADIPVATIADDYGIEEMPENEPDELDEAIEALGAAAASQGSIDDDDFADFKPKKAKGKKKGFFAKIKEMFSGDVFDEDEQEEFAEKAPAETAPVDHEDEAMFEQEDSSEADELVSAAMSAINDEPVISAAEEKAEEAAETVADTVEEKAAEAEDEFEAKLDEVISETEETAAEAAEDTSDDFSIEEVTDEETDESAEEEPEDKITSTLEDILDEDPEELVKAQSEQAEIGKSFRPLREIKAKRRKYAVLGIVCGVLALIGLVSLLTGAIGMLKNIGSANDKKDRFTHVIYPAAIMDIDAFNNPSELSSEQIITATLWSIIMDKNKIGNYESQLGDTVSIPDVDVEKYAVELFGENLPAFEHCTVGPVEARFYYSDGAYNVKLRPITFTYAPDVRSVVKSGSIYTLTVDYIDELPEWMPKSVAKTVEYQLTEQNDGSYTIDSMRIISVKTSNL